MMKARQVNALIAVAAVAAAATGCATARTAPSHRRPAHASLTARETSMLRALGASDSDFGLSLLGAVCQENQESQETRAGNITLSPVSVASSLGLALLGARGATATAMERAMALPAMSRPRLAAALRVRSALLGSLQGPGVTFTQSNRIWADRSLPTRRSYIRALSSAYQATMAHEPLVNDPEQARRAINAAIGKQTRGHIPDFLPPNSLDGSIGWVLTNALYLKAAWEHAFDPTRTSKGNFDTDNGPVTASYLDGSGFKTASDAGFTAVSLPYKGDRLRMLAILPGAHHRFHGIDPGAPADRSGCLLPEAGQLRTLESKLTTTHKKAEILLPRLRLSWSGSLNGPLKALGMGGAFATSADFSGISPQACCIGFVQHAATMSVGERGTVASAATATGITATALIPHFQVNFVRPFLLVLEDARTGEPLMMAWVANPARP